MSKEKLMAEVDSIVGHIEAQVELGIDKDQVTAEQAKSLLHTFSKLDGIALDTASAVSNHISRKQVWDLTQLASFKACLRAATATRLHQRGKCRTQTMYIEHTLIQADWDMLCAHPAIDVLGHVHYCRSPDASLWNRLPRFRHITAGPCNRTSMLGHHKPYTCIR